MAVEVTGSHGPEPAGFPIVDWVPTWPDTPPSTGGKIIRSIISLILSALTAAILVAAVAEYIDDHPIATAGLLGIAAIPASVAVLVIDDILPLNKRISPAAKSHTSRDHGTGVKLVARRISPAIHLAIGGAAVYGIAGWLDWNTNGENSELLPASKNSATGANLLLTFGILLLVVLAFILITSHWKFSVYIYKDGIVRVTALPFGLGNEVFTPWENIGRITPGEFHPTENSRQLATIDLHLHSAHTPVHRRLDTAECVAIPVYALACEPSTLLSRIQFLALTPASRSLVSRSGSPRWFTPPPPSERRRLSAQSLEGKSAQ